MALVDLFFHVNTYLMLILSLARLDEIGSRVRTLQGFVIFFLSSKLKKKILEIRNKFECEASILLIINKTDFIKIYITVP